jgi:triosephosphate isomerase
MPKLIIANWKMQLSLKNSIALAKAYKKSIISRKNEIVVCPDYSALSLVGPILKNSRLILGAQDSAVTAYGAYTGEVSPVNLRTLGVKYVILGHSERRDHLHENSAIINAKIFAALSQGLIPVLCIGEKLTEKESGATRMYLKEELRHALKGIKIKTARDLVLAYEPIWAISTNKNARPLDVVEADNIQNFIKLQAAKILHKTPRVLYGGSVSPANALQFLKQPNIDGFLIGSASLRPTEFSSICSL